MEGEVFDVVIIGSGPAGLTAGIYAGRANLRTVVLGGSKWGGQLMLTTDVENFPGFPKGVLGPTLMTEMRTQSERFGGLVKEEDVTNVDFSKMPFEIKTSDTVYLGKSVIVATGAAYQWLNLPSEQKLIGRGVSSCAPCDAPFFKDKDVIVVGGGDAAMEEALTLTKFAKTVKMIHRREEFRASKIMQERVLSDPKIRVIWNTEVTEVLGETKVEGVKLKTKIGAKQTEVKVQDFAGKEITRSNGEVIWEMPIDGMFVAVGHKPATEIFMGKIALDEKGYVKRDPSQSQAKYKSMTEVLGVFVAGDVHDIDYRQAITAAGFGCMAAMDAIRWLEEHGVGKGVQGWG